MYEKSNKNNILNLLECSLYNWKAYLYFEGKNGFSTYAIPKLLATP
jgi:hypothetical protein